MTEKIKTENKSTYERVIDAAVKQLSADKNKIDENTRFVEDLGADSLDITQFVMAVEDEFGIEIPNEDIEKEKINTIGKLAKYLKKKKG